MESVTCCSYALFCQCPRRPIKFAHTDHRGAGEDELFDRMAPGMAKCAKTLAKCEIVVSGPGRAAFLEHHLGKLGEVRSSVDRPVIGRLVTAQRFGAAFENLFACENGKEVVHVDEIRLIFQRIGHISRIGHEGGSVRFAVEPDFGDAFVAVLIGIEEIDVDLMALDIALDNPDALSQRAVGIATVLVTRLRRRSEEHTSELKTLMRISYAVFCLKKKN